MERLLLLNPLSLEQLQAETTKPKEYGLSGRSGGGNVTLSIPAHCLHPEKTHFEAGP